MLKQLFIIVWTCLVCVIDGIHVRVCVRYLQGATCSFSHVGVFFCQYLCVVCLHVCISLYTVFFAEV